MSAAVDPAPLLLACSLLIALCFTPHVRGGSCWTMVNHSGRCMERLSDRVTVEECCSSPGMSHLVAYINEEMDAGTIFFWRALGGGVPCAACKDSCVDVECGPEMKCAMRNGRPKCVCEPECRAVGRHQRGPVCGSDGRSYRNVCRLRKRACRQKSAVQLAVAYQGQCQDSCEKVRCAENKQCVVDQNRIPHCVRCTRKCPKVAGMRKHVCGVDGHTYQSACHIREAACRKGKAVPIAYRGRCKPTCKNIKCRERQACLVEPASGQPRCVTCGLRCKADNSAPGVVNLVTGAGGLAGPICGSNNHTYKTWCHMMQDACATGYVIDTKHPGNCTAPPLYSAKNSSISNSLLISRDRHAAPS
ncbi:follistatin isoform X2 [Neocloeon triangulifer]|uniref:follistatin isoform X2 n=1 Tax=Neocloeon triangulifer TaxID=2078957 RepID=UPI00286F7020|nr:follistatin isoform X2 [Neocloeon triangulifer]